MGNPVAMKRVKKEISDLSKENLGGITLVPNDVNIFMWKATIPGPAGSPYEGGIFEVDIRIPENYPFSPPHLQFLTKVYHCNIASTGAICLDILKHAWSPAMSLFKVVLSLSSLLTDPNPADPLVPQIASEYKRNRKIHDATAREWTKTYATPKSAARTATPAAPIASTASHAQSSTARPINTARRSRPLPPLDTAPAPRVAGVRRSHPFTTSAAATSSTPTTTSTSSTTSTTSTVPSSSARSNPTTTSNNAAASSSSNNPITFDDSDAEAEQASSDIELLSPGGHSLRQRNRISYRAGGTGGSGSHLAGGSGQHTTAGPAPKRARLGQGGRGGTADDVIVIDE